MNKKTITAHDKTFELYITASEIAERVVELGKNISKDYKDKNPVLLCILNGAFVFAADLARTLDIDCEISFTKLSSYKGLKSSGDVKVILGLDIIVEGRHVIIVEDIVDTGITMNRFLKQINLQKPASVEIAACFVKSESIIDPVEIKYTGFIIPDRFIIGYGLDYNGHGRNWQDIYSVKDAG